MRGDDLRGEGGESHRRVEPSGGERRDRAGGIADEKAWPVGDAAEDPADGDQTAAAFDDPAGRELRHALAEPLQRRRRIEAIAIAGEAYMLFIAIVNNPRDVARRQPWIEK